MREDYLVNRQSSNRIFKFTFQGVFLLLGSILTFLLGLWLAPLILENISRLNVMADEKIFWYIARASGIISFVFLWLSMLMGLSMAGKIIPRGYPMQIINETHKFVSLFGLLFILLHAFILIGDQYLLPKFWQILIPFTLFNYRPLGVGAGQIVFYLWLLLVLSFYIKKNIGRHAWRIIHYLSFLAFWLVVLHGIISGTDTGRSLVQILYFISGASVLLLTVYRVVKAVVEKV